MAVRHIGITLQLYYTMILLYLRTILVALIFLILPFVISAIITFFTIVEVRTILLTIFSLISLAFFLVIVHLNSTLEIFVEATWYEAYMLCKKEDREYDKEHNTHHDESGHDDHGKEDHTYHDDEHSHRGDAHEVSRTTHHE